MFCQNCGAGDDGGVRCGNCGSKDFGPTRPEVTEEGPAAKAQFVTPQSPPPASSGSWEFGCALVIVIIGGVLIYFFN